MDSMLRTGGCRWKLADITCCGWASDWAPILHWLSVEWVMISLWSRLCLSAYDSLHMLWLSYDALFVDSSGFPSGGHRVYGVLFQNIVDALTNNTVCKTIHQSHHPHTFIQYIRPAMTLLPKITTRPSCSLLGQDVHLQLSRQIKPFVHPGSVNWYQLRLWVIVLSAVASSGYDGVHIWWG